MLALSMNSSCMNTHSVEAVDGSRFTTPWQCLMTRWQVSTRAGARAVVGLTNEVLQHQAVLSELGVVGCVSMQQHGAPAVAAACAVTWQACISQNSAVDHGLLHRFCIDSSQTSMTEPGLPQPAHLGAHQKQEQTAGAKGAPDGTTRVGGQLVSDKTSGSDAA